MNKVITLNPHQVDAVESINKTLLKDDRATAILPCGTGKTLVGAFAALNYNVVIVFVPSLWLMRQTYLEWSKLTAWKNANVFGICSNTSLFDDLSVDEIDEIPVLSSIDEMTKHIKSIKPQKRNLVFCTYHSSANLSLAMPSDFWFEFSVLDEAHSTAGLDTSLFSTVLFDKNIKIKKRLSLTATPRIYDVRRKKIRGDLFPVLSMDNKALYGEHCYAMSFRSAIDQKLICDYKIIISVITKQDISREILHQYEVEGLAAEDAAKAIAMEKACKKYGLKKGIAFFNTIAEAEEFSLKVAPTFLNGYKQLHISSKMPKKDRHVVMERLEYQDNIIVSNARCLTMGIDVPSVDFVAFMRTKRGEIDIIQALGRTLRRNKSNPDKQVGYVFIPLFFDTHADNNLEELIADANLTQLWSVLEAIKEEDEVFDSWVKLSRGELGLTQKFTHQSPNIIIEGAKGNISESLLREAIDNTIIENFSEHWDEMFGKLVKYKAKYGDFKVNVKNDRNYEESLAAWVKHQRQRWNTTLTPYKRSMLLAIGFEADPLATNFQTKYAILEKHFNETGSGYIPMKKHELSNWACFLRKKYKAGKLTPEQIDALESVGFVWEAEQDAVDSFIESFEQHIKKTGSTSISANTYRSLSQLASKVRRKYKQGKLPIDKQNKLKALGFSFSPIMEAHQLKIKAIVEHYREHGSFKAPVSSDVYKYISTYKTSYRLNQLDKEIAKKLMDIGLDFRNSKLTGWDKRFKELKQYFAENNVTRLPSDHHLYRWFTGQKKRIMRKAMLPEHLEKLESIGARFD